MERRKAEPPSTASITVLTTIWSTELRLEISAQMVHDVREDVKANYHRCSVCYMVVGKADPSHVSGSGCRTLPLDDMTDGWGEFKEKLKFLPGLFCFKCFLPSVQCTPLT